MFVNRALFIWADVTSKSCCARLTDLGLCVEMCSIDVVVVFGVGSELFRMELTCMSCFICVSMEKLGLIYYHAHDGITVVVSYGRELRGWDGW